VIRVDKKENEIVQLYDELIRLKINEKITQSAFSKLKSFLLYDIIKQTNKKTFNSLKNLDCKLVNNNINDIVEQILMFHLKKKKNDYDFLNKGHLLAFPIFHIGKGIISISKPYKNIAQKIVDNGFITSKKLLELENPIKFLEKLNIYNEKLNIDENDFFENKISDELLIETLNQYDDWNTIPEEKLKEIFGESVSRPTLYEYLTCLSIFKCSGKNDYKEFVDGLGTLLNSDYTPRQHAPGGFADAIYKLFNYIVVIEPTLVTKNILRHEWNIRKHIEKANADCSLLICPKFDELTLGQIYKFSQKDEFNNKNGKKIIPITNHQIAQILKSHNYVELMENYFDNWFNAFDDIDQFKTFANKLNI